MKFPYFIFVMNKDKGKILLKTFLEKDDIWALSFTITGRCNCDCSYCHFYASRDREKYNYDMSDEQFDNYVSLIKHIKTKYHNKIQVRFSGGEPLILGDRLFELSKRLFDKTGCSSYVLTNGRLLTPEIIEKSKKSHIKAYLVSIENPYDQSEGAPNTDSALQKIKEYNCEDVQVLPAIMVIKNKHFDKLFDIANYVYDKIGMLPSYSELTYHAFETPSQKEIDNLYENVKKIAIKYYGIAAIRIFPYISPELYANDQKNYLSELDLENSIGVTSDNISEVAENMFQKLHNSYKENPCQENDCDWYEDCRIIKWMWLHSYDNSTISIEQKLKDFCNMKKAINSGLLEGILINREKIDNEAAIEEQ